MGVKGTEGMSYYSEFKVNEYWNSLQLLTLDQKRFLFICLFFSMRNKIIFNILK